MHIWGASNVGCARGEMWESKRCGEINPDKRYEGETMKYEGE